VTLFIKTMITENTCLVQPVKVEDTYMSLYQRIPEDVLHGCVFPYTHCPKPANFLRDIKTFESDFALARNYISPEDQDIGFFLTRIIFYCNNYLNVHEMQSCMLGDIIRRSLKYKNRYGLDIYYHVMDMTHAPKVRHCRYLWGLMTPGERTDFINNFVLIDDPRM
jgi:hypothetical protein